ncbi:polysaccharide biosynthesis protein [Alicyclobacillus sp. SO9]|uniref:putative polysaccharide biosynthesis protein n=1 Tax=Alicyclobacillus sp. SO9 TaxID=2665646 RepID=UPI0018E83F40|nr:polysaccharide biosynthesis protein [Alicyclobacillus sp. SO9]QQE79411.1 polysaccharide biosynthesis protein [Alicyclobacillus sp. SO9]
MAGQKGFVQGAMLLAAAAAVSKVMGSVYTIVLQNVIGDRGMGLFQMAYPIYATLLAIATAGFPVAISKLVSERLALGDVQGSKKVFKVSSMLLTAAGIASFCLLFFGAAFWARVAGDEHAVWAIRAIAPALLFVPMLSVLRGYFQGHQWMQPTATSQVLEQLVRVVTIIGLAMWLEMKGYSHAISAAGAAFGAVTGAIAGFALLLYYWLHRHPHVDYDETARVASSWSLAKTLVYYAFPISLGAMVIPLMNNVDVVTVVNLLKETGDAQGQATTQFGLLTGRAFKLMMLPTTLASGIGIAVMPAVSEAFTLGFRRLMSNRIDTAIRLTVILALPSAVGLALLAKPVDVALFKDTAGAAAIQVIAFATVFAGVQLTVAAVLQGCGWMYLPVIHLLIAAGVKLVGNLLFIPYYGIEGAAAATVVSYAVAAVLNFAAMRRLLKERFNWLEWVVKPSVAVFIMAAAVFGAYQQWLRMGGLDLQRWTIAASAMAMVGIGIIVYGVALMATGLVRENELARIPKVGPQLVLWCSRVGLLR